MSNLKEQYLKFLQLEEELGLFYRKIGGIRYWELSRVEVFLTLYERKVGGGPSKPSKFKGLTKLLFYIKSLFNLLKNPFFCSQKEILFSGGQRRVLTEDGKWWDIHIDPLLDKLNLSYMSLEYPINLEHYGPTKTSFLYYFDVLITIGFLRRKLGLTKIHITADDLEILRQIQAEVNRRFEVNLDILDIIINRLHERQALFPLCLKLLKRVKPKLVVMVTNYARKSLVEACKLLKIPTIEIQHGVISPYHPGYSFPKCAYNNVDFPNYLLVFGDYWKDVAAYPINKENIISVGYPYLEKKIQQYSRSKRKKQIVFISQSRIGVPISKFAVNLCNVPDLDYKIIYKLHPREVSDWRTRYPWLASANIEVIDTLGTDLYKLLGESMIQVGVSSTAIYEGLAYGLRTFLLDVLGVEYFDTLIQTKLVHKVSSVDEMVRLLRSNEKEESVDSSILFSPDGVEQTINFLNSIYNKITEHS
ncbi:hypothetical protein EU527_04210 [Candidatus Thorarchaeota archaeon]|nr:MAG: hypothetical protein EU527_04210 [Candidatus Thorarchaeota archaeon]